MEVNPREGSVFARLGKSYMNLGDYPEAKKAYRRAIELGVEQVGVYHGLGVISEQEGKWEAARSYYHQALLKDASHADSYHRLGGVTEELDEGEQAAALYLEAIEQDPGHAAAHHSLARLYLEKGRREEGERLMQVFSRLKEYEQRLEECRRGAGSTARDPPATYELGPLQLELRRRRSGAQMFGKLLKQKPGF